MRPNLNEKIAFTKILFSKAIKKQLIKLLFHQLVHYPPCQTTLEQFAAFEACIYQWQLYVFF